MLAVGGAYSNPGAGPFPADGLIPFMKPLYDYSWAVGLVTGFVVYLAVTAASPAERGDRARTPVPAAD